VTSAVAAPESSGPIPSLDGIRAVAVSLVFLSHDGLGGLIPGGLGVTIFFVLSGFLITTLLRSEYARTGRLNYRGFYLRRILRLMPPLFVVIAVTGGLAALGVIDGAFTVPGLLSTLFYFGNYFVIANDFRGLPAGIGVVWSLAIEEHYYLLFPPVAALLLASGRTRVTALSLGLLCSAVLAWRCWLLAHGASTAYLTMATDTRVDAILIGCAMALLKNPWLDPVKPFSRRRETTLALAAVAVLIGTLLVRDAGFRVTLRYTLQSLAIAPLIYLAVARAQRAPFRWLNAAPLVYLGTVSYTIYLVHQVVMLGIGKHFPGLGTTALGVATIAVTLLVAEPMRRWVEEPCARLRRRLHGRQAAGRARAPKLTRLASP
jgi:peptidoglycan/LPS O-acetylase OafA/YrhL